MENGPKFIINTDGIEAVARNMALAGISFAEGAEAAVKLSKAMSVFLGMPKIKRRHTRYKQIERARAMMERGQKGK